MSNKRREPQVTLPLSDYNVLVSERNGYNSQLMGIRAFLGLESGKSIRDELQRIQGVLENAEELAVKNAQDAEKWRRFNNVAYGGDVTDRMDEVIQMRDDAELGELVRKFPAGYRLDRMTNGQWRWSNPGVSDNSDRFYNGPEEAIRAMLNEE